MKSKVAYLTNEDEFVIKDYNNAKPFASFFPAIAGLWGKPMWVFYVNRGQAITCMGTTDKDGAIMEFLAANKAYRLTPRQGFRTFIKSGAGSVYEPFKNSDGFALKGCTQRMHITSHLLKLAEVNKSLGFEVSVEYFTIPGEKVPAFARVLTVKNISRQDKNIECIDGLPMVVPYGIGDSLLKNVSRLAEGWFSGVQYTKGNKVPFYKLQVVPEDAPEILEIKSANFYAGFYFKKGKEVSSPGYIVNPDDVFGELKDFAFPAEFSGKGKFRFGLRETAENKTPSSFGHFKTRLKKGEEVKYTSLIGMVRDVSDIDSFISRAKRKGYLDKKKDENRKLIGSIGSKIAMKSSSAELDNYCRQTFLDNLLRGGYPITIGGDDNKINYYVYSRIHGDMEREYNNFVILPEYFSQGNGNYRDVNQNRRNDVFFNTEVKDESIVYFLNLIQTDGFNPLKILGSKFKVENQSKFLKIFKKGNREKIKSFLSSPFSLGSFFNLLEKEGINVQGGRKKVINILLSCARRIDYAAGEVGYWSDHWHYNIDLIEAFLAVYPEELEQFLLNRKEFTFYDNPMVVNPRSEKYVLFTGRPRQLNAVSINPQKEKMIEGRRNSKNVVRRKFGKGGIYKTTLIGKLICIVTNKFASLDTEGVGIEMETDKPDWCDALNGLPGVFGASISETLELKRLIVFILDSFSSLALDDRKKIKTAEEIVAFLVQLDGVAGRYSRNAFRFWDERHNILEKYRKKTMMGLSGAEKEISVGRIKKILEFFLKVIDRGISKAWDKKSGVISTNFESQMLKYKVLKERGRDKKNIYGLTCIKPLKFKHRRLPLFLEGPVHYLRVNKDKGEAKRLHSCILKSGLYDRKLKMFKVNAPMTDESIHIGRIKVFTPGWLENESVWMHMEYKYLFELLRKGLVKEFYSAIKTSFVPFMDPKIYGRSIFENVSFIASSAHPEESIHGQGFVSRLSGSTAEFVSIWICMTSGLNPFYIENGKLCLKFDPKIAGWLFTDKEEKVVLYREKSATEEITLPKNSFLFRFLGSTTVIYHNPSHRDTFGNKPAKVTGIRLAYFGGNQLDIVGDVIKEPYSRDVRNGKINRIYVMLG